MNGVRCILIVVLTVLFGCTSREPVPEDQAPISQPAPAQQPQALDEAVRPNAPPESEPQLLEGTGETAWAEGSEEGLIAGIDGEVYEPYSRAAIERVQRALQNRSLYAGPINGVLDTPTMKAIYAFQQATYHLQLCGVPTPRTRWMLEQGSHTDPA